MTRDWLSPDNREALAQEYDIDFTHGLPTWNPPPGKPKPLRHNAARKAVKKRKPTRKGPSSYKQLREWLEEEGYQVVQANNGHLAVLRPNGSYAYQMALTPSDRRSLINAVTDLRRITGLSLRR